MIDHAKFRIGDTMETETVFGDFMFSHIHLMYATLHGKMPSGARMIKLMSAIEFMEGSERMGSREALVEKCGVVKPAMFGDWTRVKLDWLNVDDFHGGLSDLYHGMTGILTEMEHASAWARHRTNWTEFDEWGLRTSAEGPLDRLDTGVTTGIWMNSTLWR